jgi:hypothetical protein
MGPVFKGPDFRFGGDLLLPDLLPALPALPIQYVNDLWIYQKSPVFVSLTLSFITTRESLVVFMNGTCLVILAMLPAPLSDENSM